MKYSSHLWAIIVIMSIITIIYYVFFTQFEWFWWYSIFEAQNKFIGAIYFIPFIYTSLIFGWRGAAIVWFISLILIYPRIQLLTYHAHEIISNIALSMLPMLTVIVYKIERQWREKQKTIMHQHDIERQEVTTQILKTQERERIRIAQEIHDTTIQNLLAIANNINSLKDELICNIPICSRNKIDSVKDSILDIVKELRSLSLDLRPSVLDTLGLISALKWLLQNMSKDTSIETEFNLVGFEEKLTPLIETMLFRIVQESINNIRRHANATKVQISVEFVDNPRLLLISVKDNGKGFIFDDKTEITHLDKKMGITGMMERAKTIDANIKIISNINQGTNIIIKIPIN